MLLRIRLSSFLAGVAVAGAFSLYQIREDIQKSHELLSAQVRSTIFKQDDWDLVLALSLETCACKNSLVSEGLLLLVLRASAL